MLVDLIRLAKPWIGEDEQRAVAAVLQSGQIAQGALVRRFEHAVAALTGREHGVAVSSGTAALQLALQALGIGEGSEVLCPALTWPSPAHAIALARADVRFVEVDPNEWNSTGEALAAARTTRSRAAIVIDQFGNPARDSEIRALLGDLPLIEDAACALGSRFAHEPCGSLGEIACLSFHPRKIITTGEGGICLTDDLAVANRLRALRDHGRLDGTFLEAAGNFRMTEVAAALETVAREAIPDGARRSSRRAGNTRGGRVELPNPRGDPPPRLRPRHGDRGARAAWRRGGPALLRGARARHVWSRRIVTTQRRTDCRTRDRPSTVRADAGFRGRRGRRGIARGAR